MSQTLFQKKICMLGRFGVGKTSLTRRFVYQKFDDSYLSTIGVKVNQKLLSPIETAGGKIVQFNFLIWDIEGIEDKPARPVSNYFIGAAAAILVGDMTRKDTLEDLPEIAARFRKASPQAKLVVAGNKTDLINGDSTSLEVLSNVAGQMECEFFVTSAKTGDKVEECFQKIGLLLAE